MATTARQAAIEQIAVIAVCGRIRTLLYLSFQWQLSLVSLASAVRRHA